MLCKGLIGSIYYKVLPQCLLVLKQHGCYLTLLWLFPMKAVDWLDSHLCSNSKDWMRAPQQGESWQCCQSAQSRNIRVKRCRGDFELLSSHPLLPYQGWTTVRTFLGICLLGFTSAFRNGSCGPMMTTCLKYRLWRGWSSGRSLWVLLCHYDTHPKMFRLC